MANNTEAAAHFARLDALRARHHITWRQIGEIVGLSTSSIMNIKAGERALNANALQRLAEAEQLAHIERNQPPPPEPKTAPDKPASAAPGRPKKIKPEPKPDENSVTLAALDLLAECYRRDVAFLLGIITKDNPIRFSAAFFQAPGAAVEDLREQAGIHDAGVALTGVPGEVVRKLIGS